MDNTFKEFASEVIKYIIVSVSSFFAPTSLLLVAVFFLCLFEYFVSRVARVINKKDGAKPYEIGLWMKIVMYLGLLLTVFIMDRSTFNESVKARFGVDYMATYLVCCVIYSFELKNINKNWKVIFGKSIWGQFSSGALFVAKLIGIVADVKSGKKIKESDLKDDEEEIK